MFTLRDYDLPAFQQESTGLEARGIGGRAASNAAIFSSVNTRTQFGRRCGEPQGSPVPIPGLPTCTAALPRLEARESGLTKPNRSFAMSSTITSFHQHEAFNELSSVLCTLSLGVAALNGLASMMQPITPTRV